jgi:hypothetical protein
MSKPVNWVRECVNLREFWTHMLRPHLTAETRACIRRTCHWLRKRDISFRHPTWLLKSHVNGPLYEALGGLQSWTHWSTQEYTLLRAPQTGPNWIRWTYRSFVLVCIEQEGVAVWKIRDTVNQRVPLVIMPYWQTLVFRVIRYTQINGSGARWRRLYKWAKCAYINMDREIRKEFLESEGILPLVDGEIDWTYRLHESWQIRDAAGAAGAV